MKGSCDHNLYNCFINTIPRFLFCFLTPVLHNTKIKFAEVILLLPLSIFRNYIMSEWSENKLSLLKIDYVIQLYELNYS